METASQKRVLVTGASGFIGARLMRRLIEQQFAVSCLVRAKSRVEALRSSGVQLITGDVTDRNSVERALSQSQAETVFHLAGLVRTRHRDDFMRVNASGVEHVAAGCAGCGCPPVLIVVSSLAAVGPSNAESRDAGQACVESDAPAPVSHYGRSKLAGEKAAAKYAATVPITIVRPPIVFGPEDHAVLEMFRPIARRGVHVVPGYGDRHFSLIHVDDLVEGLLIAAAKGERLPPRESLTGQGIYFLAGDDQPTYVQLGQMIASALEKKPPTVIRVPGPMMKLIGVGADMMAWIRRRPGWISRDKITESLAGSWICSSAKAREQLGWSPSNDLADQLHETADWYRSMGWL